MRAFVVKDYVPLPFTGEGKPQDILGGFRSWEAEWEDARKTLDKCPGVTAPIRLTKLQLALGGAALKLVKSIHAGTDDGYDIAPSATRSTNAPRAPRESGRLATPSPLLLPPPSVQDADVETGARDLQAGSRRLPQGVDPCA